MAAEKLLRRLHDHATKNGKKLLAEPFHYFDMIDHFVNNDYYNKDEWDLMRVSIQAKESVHRVYGSTVVDISISPPSFKLVPLSSPRSPLSKTPKHVIF